MARLRPGACYRKPKRAYTRVSRYRKDSYVRGVPGLRVRKFEMGDTKREFDHVIELKSKDYLQIRHNALEAFRISVNKQLEKRLGKKNYHFKLVVYPHQVMRHRPMANFAGADRFSSGMKHAFGKPLGRSAIVKKGQTIALVRANDIDHVKQSFKIGSQKLPCKTTIEIVK